MACGGSLGRPLDISCITRPPLRDNVIVCSRANILDPEFCPWISSLYGHDVLDIDW